MTKGIKILFRLLLVLSVILALSAVGILIYSGFMNIPPIILPEVLLSLSASVWILSVLLVLIFHKKKER